MARLLTEKGYRDVWPLLGGFDAWEALGYPVERIPTSVPQEVPVSAARSSA
jgi:3-mercaptopyruvate sulfurtransferase SseA